MQVKPNAASAVVAAVFVLATDVRQQPRQQRLMNGRVAARVDIFGNAAFHFHPASASSFASCSCTSRHSRRRR
jgi:hypothetical protein